MLDKIQEHKKHSPTCKGPTLRLPPEHKTVMQIDETAISLLLIE